MEIDTVLVLSLLLACFSGVLGLYGLLLKYVNRLGKMEGRLDALCEKVNTLVAAVVKVPSLDPDDEGEDEENDG